MIEDNDELLRLFEEILKNQQASFIDKFKKISDYEIYSDFKKKFIEKIRSSSLMQIRGEYKNSDGLRKTAMIQQITIEGLKLFGKTLMKAKRKMIIKGILITVVGSVHPTLVLVIPATVDKLDELFEADNLLEGLGDSLIDSE